MKAWWTWRYYTRKIKERKRQRWKCLKKRKRVCRLRKLTSKRAGRTTKPVTRGSVTFVAFLDIWLRTTGRRKGRWVVVSTVVRHNTWLRLAQGSKSGELDLLLEDKFTLPRHLRKNEVEIFLSKV